MQPTNLPQRIQRGMSPALVESPQQFIEGLPAMMLSLIERRYLSGLQPQNWEIGGATDGLHLPVMREIVRLGRTSRPGEFQHAMPHLLNACHSPGHALVMVVHGAASRHRIYFGGRRCSDSAATATPDYLEHQQSALKAYFPGIEMSHEPMRLNGGEMPELAHLLQTAPALGLMTGIPSGRSQHFPGDLQSLDRLVDSVGNHHYALVVVAEPVEPAVIDEALDRFRTLKSEVHAWVNITLGRTRQESLSQSVVEEAPPEAKSLTSHLPSILFSLSSFLQIAGIPIGPAVNSLAFAATNLNRQKQPAKAAPSASHTTGTSDSATAQILNANAAACENLLDQLILRITAGRSTGWWQTAIYVAAESKAGLHAVTAAVRSIGTGDQTTLEPIRLITLPAHHVRASIEEARILSLRPGDGGQTHPLGEMFDHAATCLNSAELAKIISLPNREIPGLPMRQQADFGLCVPPPEDGSIELGQLLDGKFRELDTVTIPFSVLNRHVFVTGMTGYGKTTTCKRLLLESYEQRGVPFLVIEPAKSEYQELAAHPALRGKLRVYAMGGQSALPFRLNPLQIIPGIPLARHIDLLKAVFNASFPMFAGMPYVLEEAIHEVYRERGWSFYDSKNALLRDSSSLDDIAALTPSLEDLYEKIDQVLAEKKYGREIEQNLGAALRSRIKSLLMGNKGLVLNTRRSTPLNDLFRGPTVIELQDFGDDEEKAFVMALMFVLLYEYAETRQRDLPPGRRGGLQHLTLIEEAHRLLQAGRSQSSAELGDARGKAVSMFADMLAEMRAYGEGFIIADQSPTKLIPDTLKNSGLKIIHRLAYPDDRAVVGACVNLDHDQTAFLNNLGVGLAVVHDDRIGAAVLARIHTLTRPGDEADPSPRPAAGGVAPEPEDRRHLHRHGGCRACPSPCDFFHQLKGHSPSPAAPGNLDQVFDLLLLGDADEAWNVWTGLRPRPGPEPGLAYCAGAQAAFAWAGRLLRARNALLADQAQAPGPEEFVRRDRAARAISGMLSAWTKQTELDAAARSAFVTAQELLRKEVSAQPPVELPGCESCPARCRMLPFAAVGLRTVEKSLAGKLLGERGKDAVEHLQEVQQWLERSLAPVSPAALSPANLNQWTYCVLVNASFPASVAARKTAFLDLLRQPRPTGASGSR